MHEFLAAHGCSALFLLGFLASTLIPLGSKWLLIALVVKGFEPLPEALVATSGNVFRACSSYFIGIYGSDGGAFICERGKL
jgi:membrane protein YqaA with SNARE-associated domain